MKNKFSLLLIGVVLLLCSFAPKSDVALDNPNSVKKADWGLYGGTHQVAMLMNGTSLDGTVVYVSEIDLSLLYFTLKEDNCGGACGNWSVYDWTGILHRYCVYGYGTIVIEQFKAAGAHDPACPFGPS